MLTNVWNIVRIGCCFRLNWHRCKIVKLWVYILINPHFATVNVSVYNQQLYFLDTLNKYKLCRTVKFKICSLNILWEKKLITFWNWTWSSVSSWMFGQTNTVYHISTMSSFVMRDRIDSKSSVNFVGLWRDTNMGIGHANEHLHILPLVKALIPNLIKFRSFVTSS